MKVISCRVVLIPIIIGLLSINPFLVFAQSAEEREFLLMYFKQEELVVESATRSSKSLTQVAENVTVITANDIRLMNAHTVADVLNSVVGVQVFSIGGPGSQAMAYIQGSEQKHVMVLVDGVVFNNLGANVADLGMISAQMIEKVEIVKGPASSTWGSALGGVINIITKSGDKVDGRSGEVFTSFGTKYTEDLRAEARGKNSKIGYYLSAGRLQSDGLTQNMDLSTQNIYAKLNYDIAEATEILLALGYIKGARGDGLYADYDMSFNDTFKNLHSVFAMNTALSKELELNLSFRTIRQELIMGIDQLSSGSFLMEDTFNGKGYGSSAKLAWNKSYHTIVFGCDYDNQTLESNTIAQEQQIQKWASFVNDTIQLDKLSITPGIRYEKTDTNGDITSPSLGITYTMENNAILRATAANGFSIPLITETKGNTVFYVPNPGLKMEKIRSYQAGLETTALHNLWLKLVAFRNEISDAISSEPVSASSFRAINSERQRRQGIEIELKTSPIYDMAASAGAEYIDAQDLDTGMRLANIPVRVYDIGLHYGNEQTLKALFLGRYIDWNATPSVQGEYSSIIFDLHVSKTITMRNVTSLDVFADVHNIFNGSQYMVSLYRNPERWFEGGIRYTF